MKPLMDCTPEELSALMKDYGQPAFRGKQLYAWLMAGAPWEDMTNLPKALRERLARETPRGGARLEQKRVSQKDGTVKYLFALADGNVVEGVLMRYHYGNTLCISTQVGCRMGCAFCASTLEGCVRNLTAGEMLGEVAAANADEGTGRNITNIVLMGSGEPLDNYEEVVAFLRLVNRPEGLGVSLRNISLSTCGLVPQMRRLAEEGLPVTLSLSLHAPDDALRRRIMPVAQAYALEDVLDAARYYIQRTGRRVILEYALIGGLNDAPEQAEALSQLLRGMQCHVNVIPLNDVPERNLSGSTPQRVQAFLQVLERRGISATQRREMGADIEGACGQLRRKVLQDHKEG